MSVFSKLPVMLSNIEDIDIRYENGCIYILKHKTDDTKEYYVGSTKDFKRRCRTHKRTCNNENDKDYNCKVYKYIRENDGWDQWEIVKLYDYPCKNKYELELEERKCIKAYKSTLNQIIPTRTKTEYQQINREKIAEYKKQYHQINRENILEKQREYRENNKEKKAEMDRQYIENNREEINAKRRVKINCDNCNLLISKGVLARHKRSNYCINHK